jgi:hypothetical protein
MATSGVRIAAMSHRPYFGLGALLVAATLSTPARAEEGAPAACLASYEQAQRLRLKQALSAAKRELLVCAKPTCPEVLRRDCTTWLAEVERAQPSIVVSARAGSEPVNDVTIMIDGNVVTPDQPGSPIVLDPGKHELQAESIDHDPVSVAFELAAGEKKKQIAVDFGSAPPVKGRPERNLTPVYGLAALGVVGLGSFAFFALRSHSRKSDLESCKGHCPEEDVDRVKRDQLIADVSLGVGLLCLGGATYLYLSKPSSKESVRLGFAPRARGMQAQVEASF